MEISSNKISTNLVKIIYGCLQLYLWNKFPQNKPKLWKFTRILCSLSDCESRYFEEISNPRKSVCGGISTFLMSVGVDINHQIVSNAAEATVYTLHLYNVSIQISFRVNILLCLCSCFLFRLTPKTFCQKSQTLI